VVEGKKEVEKRREKERRRGSTLLPVPEVSKKMAALPCWSNIRTRARWKSTISL
jgi:hypothetical protein